MLVILPRLNCTLQASYSLPIIYPLFGLLSLLSAYVPMVFYFPFPTYFSPRQFLRLKYFLNSTPLPPLPTSIPTSSLRGLLRVLLRVKIQRSARIHRVRSLTCPPNCPVPKKIPTFLCHVIQDIFSLWR